MFSIFRGGTTLKKVVIKYEKNNFKEIASVIPFKIYKGTILQNFSLIEVKLIDISCFQIAYVPKGHFA